QVGEIAPRGGDVALLRQHHPDAQLRDPATVALGHRLVARDRIVVMLLLLGDLREVELDHAVLAVFRGAQGLELALRARPDRKSTRLNSSHGYISYAVFCL